MQSIGKMLEQIFTREGGIIGLRPYYFCLAIMDYQIYLKVSITRRNNQKNVEYNKFGIINRGLDASLITLN